MSSLLGTGAPSTSDMVALFEVGIALALLGGMFLARRGYIRAHMIVQSSMVLVNIPVVLAWMVPQYLEYVLPDVGSELSNQFYWVPTLMLAAGIAAESLGIYILLVAGTNLVPQRLRFRRYKLWMRTELILWWSVVTLGLSTYYVWYVPH
ncbi:MAG: hypothetical protein L3K19_06730 [Thermoplasmata archaeon]|nr:hypothetical protein [Thermoplasmata archaeon]